MEINWQYIKDHPTRCQALGQNDGVKFSKIYAKVWRLDNGEWAFAINSNVCKTPDFAGTERNRRLAKKAVEDKIDRSKLNPSAMETV